MTRERKQRPKRMKTANQAPYMPGEEAKKKGEIPTGEHRNDDYGQGRHSGAAAGGKRRAGRAKDAQEQELETNEENR